MKIANFSQLHGEEKSLRHVAMVAKFFDDKKPKIRIILNFIDRIQFRLICQILTKFSGFNPKGPHLSLEKERETFCVVFNCSYSAKRAREIRKFQNAVVQRRLRNVQKKRDTPAKLLFC